MPPPRIVIVSPASAADNNGNWQTARRWQRLLSPDFASRIVRDWPDAGAAGDEAMIALHARRSADAVAAWTATRGAGPALVLTGTDLYRDLAHDAAAQRSVKLARVLVVLQARGIDALPPAARGRAIAIHQSARSRKPAAKTARHLRAVMVGHLREVKSPDTLFAAARLLGGRDDILIDHIGGALEAGYAARARATARACPGYRWLGALDHAATRERVRRAHVLVIASRMEGGANAIVEAVTAGTPVLASRVDGNVGMLGADYAGYFAHGDAAELAALLDRCREAQDSPRGLLARLMRQCTARATLFAPSREARAVKALAARLVNP